MKKTDNLNLISFNENSDFIKELINDSCIEDVIQLHIDAVLTFSDINSAQLFTILYDYENFFFLKFKKENDSLIIVESNSEAFSNLISKLNYRLVVNKNTFRTLLREPKSFFINLRCMI